MPKVTFEITPAQRKLMDARPEVNWSETLRQAIMRKATAAEVAKGIEEELNDPLVKELAAILKKGVGERWRRESRR